MVKFIKLRTGEEIIAQLDPGVGGYYLKNPAMIIITQEGIGLMPWLPFLDEKIFIKEEDVLLKSSLKQEMANAYNSRFGSGLVTAPAGTLNQIGPYKK